MLAAPTPNPTSTLPQPSNPPAIRVLAGCLQLVPVDPPTFLQPVHAALMRAGCQLRLLHSLEGRGRQLVQQLRAVAEVEAQRRQAVAADVAAADLAAAEHSVTTFAAALPSAAAACGGAEVAALLPEERQPWLALAGSPAAAWLVGVDSSSEAAAGSLNLQLTSSGLQAAVQISQERDAARAAEPTLEDAYLLTNLSSRAAGQ